MTCSCVLDASAILAWLQREPGSGTVGDVLSTAGVSAVNWSEVLQKSAQRGLDLGHVGGLLQALGLTVLPFDANAAADAATLWLQVPSLSLADRCCLALARHLGVPAITADRAWRSALTDMEIRVIR